MSDHNEAGDGELISSKHANIDYGTFEPTDNTRPAGDGIATSPAINAVDPVLNRTDGIVTEQKVVVDRNYK